MPYYDDPPEDWCEKCEEAGHEECQCYQYDPADPLDNPESPLGRIDESAEEYAGALVDDESAEEQFQREWNTYFSIFYPYVSKES